VLYAVAAHINIQVLTVH